MRKQLFLVVAFQSILVPLAAQAPPSAQRTGHEMNFWVGASVSIFNPDYGCHTGSPFSCGGHQLIGVGPYLDTSYFMWGMVGLEGEARLLLWHGPETLIESSYLAGPRLRILRVGQKLDFTGKFLLGAGNLDVPGHLLGAGTYFAYAPAATVDYHVTRNVTARVEYEYQFWPAYKCFKCTNGGNGGLTPNGFAFGVSYQIPSPHSGTAAY